MAERLEDFEITKDELDRFGEALKKKEFRDLLVEYCEELTDPENRRKYEEEIIELEKERGIAVTFINPQPGYVIKSSLDGNKLAFINVCSNEHVDKPSSRNVNNRGSEWSLPHLLSPPREDMSKKGARCKVFDVIFHPETLYLTSKSVQYRNMVNNISCEAVERNFNVCLDKTNLKFPKMKFKGMSRPLVIRKKVGEKTQIGDSEVDKIYTDFYQKLDEHYETAKPKENQNKSMSTKKKQEYTEPKYVIKHRSDIDIQDFTYDPASKLNAAIPKELIIEINLPLLKSAGDVNLDVTEKSLKIISEKPSKYKLELTLPYNVNEESGNAKFDSDSRKLIVTLPVRRKCNLLSDIGRYDSGVDSDCSPSSSEQFLPLIEELTMEENIKSEDSVVSSVQSESDLFRTSETSDFLNPDLHYSFPEYTCHLFDNILSFTINIKNVEPDSIKKQYNDLYTSVHIKFCSISSGYFPLNYAFFVSFPTHFIDHENLSIEPWDNNLILQIPYRPADKIISTYFIGVSSGETEEKTVDEPSIINQKHLKALNETENESSPNVQVQLDSDDELTIIVNPDEENEEKLRTLSESSVDEPKNEDTVEKIRCLSESDESSISQSPVKGKSILKSHSRGSVSRSVSESSIDEYTWSSFENCAANSEPFIPEEAETLSSSMKKTVRFNDVVSKQLFRTNSSILGQKKKNQRKRGNKKKAQERRLSESENSEAEDKKDKTKFTKTEKNTENSKQNKAQIDFKSDLIFDLDM